MNHGFRLRYDQLRESDPTASEQAVSTPISYEETDKTRSVCFLWPDGRRAFFNYAYLANATFEPTGAMNTICLTFSSQVVTLQGYGLEPLFMAFFEHLPRLVTAIDPRYVLHSETNKPVVVDMQVQPVST